MKFILSKWHYHTSLIFKLANQQIVIKGGELKIEINIFKLAHFQSRRLSEHIFKLTH